MIWGSCQCWSGKKCFDGYVPVLGSSQFYVRIVGSENRPGPAFFILKKSPF
jgi:hypothetical protein